jgi:class 3 adenylate cyclase
MLDSILKRRLDDPRVTPGPIVTIARDQPGTIAFRSTRKPKNRSDHAIFAGNWPTLCGDVEEFVSGHRETTLANLDRVIATVLFTDIIDSTRRAAEMGDQAWRRMLDEHDRTARRIVMQHRGNLVKTTGDGILATFYGPERAIRCALALEAAAMRIGLPCEQGLHRGEIELRDDDVGGSRSTPPPA